MPRPPLSPEELALIVMPWRGPVGRVDPALLLLTLLASATACGSRTGLLLAEGAPTGDDAGQAGEAGPVGSAPRPIAPLSTSTATNRTPTLRWALAAGTDGVIVDICHDRACSRLLSSFTAIGTSAKVATALPPGVVFWRLRGTAHGAPGGGFSPTWEFTVGRRSAPVDTSWGSTLDVNGDGLADVVVGADGANDYAGAAYRYMSGASGLRTPPQVLPLPPKASNFGGVVGSSGDVDGDGFGDLVIAGGTAGAAYVYLGGPSGPSTAPSYRLDVTAFHVSVADTNGDGYADVLASEDGGHAVDVFFGGPSGPAATAQVLNVGGIPMTGSYGASVAGAGDVDGDGFEDVLAGGYTGNLAFLFRAGASGPDPTPITIADPGSSPNDTFGLAVAGASDVDGDGFDDVLVGAPGMTLQVGRAYLFFGGPSGPRTPPTVLQDPVNGQLDLFGDALQ